MSDPLSRRQHDEFYALLDETAPEPAKPERKGPDWAYLPDRPDNWAVAVAIICIVAGVILGFTVGASL